MLPQVTFLYLAVFNKGHAFGASLFHLLRMCTGIRKLIFILSDNRNSEAQSACPSDCICDEPTSWKTEGLVLNHLESANFYKLQGSDHEVTFLKQLFNWATVLTNMTITFGDQVTESKAREFRQALVGYSRPETSVNFCLTLWTRARHTCSNQKAKELVFLLWCADCFLCYCTAAS
ncbi:hypothetical protein HU200_037527 [Digitaria exilis]|uniref:FBD domain-containing protein n=1 Tax=Digitaria exilis TaxID=1010633 RepID=A0A835BF49_9POAL|nr:hypothetical protein HU200_037527 [Digitaria exilis]